MAESMGYETYSTKFTCYVTKNKEVEPVFGGEPYLPHATNNDQCMELMEKLKICVEWNIKTEQWDAFITPAAEYWISESINEAVTLAAIARMDNDCVH